MNTVTAITVAPGGTVGIFGGGQLGRMLALAAANLGLHVHIYAPESPAPATGVADKTTTADYDDKEALAKFAANVDVVTFEFENIPAATLLAVADKKPVFPNPDALVICQNRLKEKTFLNDNAIPTAPFCDVTSVDTLKQALEKIGTPCILKTQTLGYDGKGQFRIDRPDQAELAWKSIGERPAILEGFIQFEREISTIVARDRHGKMALYDTVENVHRNHILHRSIVPAAIGTDLSELARSIAFKTAETLDYVGVLAIEMFVCGDRSNQEAPILVNEMAPRVHNSGHWTIDAAKTSQFEQHIRAICGWPLGDTLRTHDAVMTNLLGHDIEDWQNLAADPDNKIHLYGKQEARDGRKMGHVTRLLKPVSD